MSPLGYGGGDAIGNQLHLYDYSPWAETHFRDYLRTERGFSLEELNRRWRTAYPKWEDVTQPKPVPGIDVSARWNDFQDFRAASTRAIFELIFRTVRETDPQGRKMHFTFNPVFAEDLCVKYGVVMDRTGSENA